MTGAPLRGLRVVVTRAARDAGSLVRALEAQGAQVIEAPMLWFEPPMDPSKLTEALGLLSTYDWIVFTSAHGVHAAFERLQGIPGGMEVIKGRRLAAVGPATRDAIEGHGCRVGYVPDVYLTERLGQTMPDVAGRRILLLRAEISNPELPRTLAGRGAHVEDIAVYRTVPDSAAGQLSPRLQREPPDWVLFSSPSTVENFDALFSPSELARLQAHARAACIGPVTRRAAATHGWTTSVVASPYTIPALVDALVQEVKPRA